MRPAVRTALSMLLAGGVAAVLASTGFITAANGENPTATPVVAPPGDDARLRTELIADVADCMRERGRPYVPLTPEQYGDERAVAAYQRARDTDDDPEAWAGDEADCVSAANAARIRLVLEHAGAQGASPGQQDAPHDVTWQQHLEGLPAYRSAVADYSRCMREQGYSVEHPQDYTQRYSTMKAPGVVGDSDAERYAHVVAARDAHAVCYVPLDAVDRAQYEAFHDLP